MPSRSQNALPTIKDEADLVTKGARGAGVAELIEAMLKDDVDAFHSSETQNSVDVGVDVEGRPNVIRPHGGSTLICGSSGGGKSTVATALLERIVEDDYQVCVFDPEGDYSEFRSAVVFGDAKAAPQPIEFVKMLERPEDKHHARPNLIVTSVQGCVSSLYASPKNTTRRS